MSLTFEKLYTKKKGMEMKVLFNIYIKKECVWNFSLIVRNTLIWNSTCKILNSDKQSFYVYAEVP